MATITEVRNALASLLTANGIRCEAFIPDSINPPCVVILPAGLEFDTAFDTDLDTLNVNLRVVTQWVSGRASQDELDLYLSGSGDLSLRAIIATDPDLGLANTDTRVVRVSDYGQWVSGDGLTYGSAVVEVEVLTEGDT